MLREFKEFALKGNLVDMAIAFIMGGAFGKVISAFIDGMVMPMIGLIQGRDFNNLYVGLNEATKNASTQGLTLAKALSRKSFKTFECLSPALDTVSI